MKNWKILALIDRALDTRATPLAYIYAIQTLLFGAAFGLFPTRSPGVQDDVLSSNDPIIPSDIWGLALAIGAALLVVGLIRVSVRLTKVGAFIACVCWMAAAVSYFKTGYLFLQLPFAVFEVLGFGYCYLSASIGRLWDYTPQSKNSK